MKGIMCPLCNGSGNQTEHKDCDSNKSCYQAGCVLVKCKKCQGTRKVNTKLKYGKIRDFYGLTPVIKERWHCPKCGRIMGGFHYDDGYVHSRRVITME